jgi:RNA polymerase sigma-70 factor (ECF subfamily)
MNADAPDSLLAKLREGDRAAVAQLFTQYEPCLRQLARRYLSPFLRTQLDSVDLVQSAWVHVLQEMPRSDWNFADGDDLRAFLLKVVRNRLVDHARRMKAGQQREQLTAAAQTRKEISQPRPSEQAQAHELWDRMQHLCPPQHRQILHFKQQGLSLEEIAGRTGLHPSSVRRVMYDLARRLALQSSGRAAPLAGD